MFLGSYSIIWKTILFTFVFLLLSFSSNIKGINLGIIELYPARIIVFGWLIYAIFSGIIKKQNKLVKPMTIFILWGFFLAIVNFNNQSITSLFVYITSFASMLMFASIANNRDDIYCISMAILLNLIIQAFLGIRESLTGEYMYVTYENYAWHYNDFGLNMPKTTFYNVNNYAVYCILCLPFVSLCNNRLLKLNIINYCVYLLGVIAIVLTGSRTGFLCISLYFILYFYYTRYKYQKNLKILIAFSVLLLFPYIFVNIIQFVDFILPSGDVTDEDRLPIWSNYINICFNNLLVYGVPGCSTELLQDFIGRNIPPHCFFLEILVEYGLIGVLSILCIIIQIKPNKDTCVPIFYKIITNVFLCLFLICSICPSSMTGNYYLWAMFGVFYSINNKQII